MRTLTATEQTNLSAAFRRNSFKLEVEGADGIYTDRTSWLQRFVTEQTVDAPVALLTAYLRRDTNSDSLAPFRSDSTANTAGTAIDAGRGIRLYAATTAYGTAPADADYHLIFDGVVDSVNFGGTPMVLEARDLLGEAVDRWVETPTEYGTDAGVAMATVLQNVMDDWLPGHTLYVPEAPTYMITTYEQQRMNVLEAMREIVGLIGWDIRLTWDGSEYRITLHKPNRTKTTPDWTFAASRYYSISSLSIDRENVRNVIKVTYRDKNTGTREEVEAIDSTSRARFGHLWMMIQEGDDSPIDTSTEAQDLADAALSDLSYPTAEKQVEMPFFWPVELGDLYRFTANNVHANSDLDLAVTRIRHEFEMSDGVTLERTILGVRGKPTGWYLGWLKKGSDPADPLGPIGIDVDAVAKAGVANRLQVVVLDLGEKATWWEAWAKLGAWPTKDGTQTGEPDNAYMVAEESASVTEVELQAKAGTWYVVARAYNQEGVPGATDTDSVAISDTATGGGLSNLRISATVGASATGSYNDVVWDHNDAVESDTGGSTTVTNQLLQTEWYDEATVWSDKGTGTITVTANAIAQPSEHSGVEHSWAEEIAVSGTSGEGGRGQAFSFTAGEQVTISHHVKKVTGDTVRITMWDGTDWATTDFTFSTASHGNPRGTTTIDATHVEALADGWYRVGFTVTPLNTGTGDTNCNLVGDGSFYAWGAQINDGATVKEYVQSTSTQGTETFNTSGAYEVRISESIAGTIVADADNRSPKTEPDGGSVTANYGGYRHTVPLVGSGGTYITRKYTVELWESGVKIQTLTAQRSNYELGDTTEDGALSNLRIHANIGDSTGLGGYNELRWDHNSPVESPGADVYEVRISENSAGTIVADADNRDPRTDPDGTSPGTANYGGYRHTVPLVPKGTAGAVYRTRSYTVELYKNAALSATYYVERSEWESGA